MMLPCHWRPNYNGDWRQGWLISIQGEYNAYVAYDDNGLNIGNPGLAIVCVGYRDLRIARQRIPLFDKVNTAPTEELKDAAGSNGH